MISDPEDSTGSRLATRPDIRYLLSLCEVSGARARALATQEEDVDRLRNPRLVS